MKKLLMILLACLLLAACGTSSTTKENKDEESNKKSEEKTQESVKSNESTEADEEQLDEDSFESGEVYDEGFGRMKFTGVGYNDSTPGGGAEEVTPIEMGPIKLSINSVLIGDMEPEGDSKELFFDNKDKVKAILIDMKAENTSDEDVSFYPNQAVIVTDTGEQVEAEMMLAGDAGGDFLGRVTKEGQTWWLLKNLDKEVKSLKLIISPPSAAESWDDLSEEKRIEFNVISYEEAVEIDKKMDKE